MKNYTIEHRRKAFVTICRTDGYWSIEWISKNKKAARRKGEEFILGKRTAVRKYVTKYGEYLNTQKSLSRRTERIVLAIAAQKI